MGFSIRRLAMTYFHMATCHTIIGAKRFHFRVRDGIGWFTLAMFTKQFGVVGSAVQCLSVFDLRCKPDFVQWFYGLLLCLLIHYQRFAVDSPVIFDFSYRLEICVCVLIIVISDCHQSPKRIGCYMVKPHGQLVVVSFTHYCASTSTLSTS